jgi:hypothetical protein
LFLISCFGFTMWITGLYFDNTEKKMEGKYGQW